MFTVIELQDDHTNVGVLTYTYPTQSEANQKFYEILFYASASTVPIHSALIVEDGYPIKSDCIIHSEES